VEKTVLDMKGAIFMEESQRSYVCPKCGNGHYEHDQFQATGGNLARVFDVQNKKFITISCSQCGYTEIYKAETSTGMNILDFLMGR
jgi:predicted nucleic-acid-binding Zn-ribbon protein